MPGVCLHGLDGDAMNSELKIEIIGPFRVEYDERYREEDSGWQIILIENNKIVWPPALLTVSNTTKRFRRTRFNMCRFAKELLKHAPGYYWAGDPANNNGPDLARVIEAMRMTVKKFTGGEFKT